MKNNKVLKIQLITMNLLQFAIWGAYLTCMGRYLGPHGLGKHIGLFYSIQGIVSIFMPALLGIVADRWIPAQKMLGISHGISGAAMICAGIYGISAGMNVQFGPLFALYTLGVAFYMPTLALSNAVAYNALDKAGLDTVKAFPPIRVFGTIGFIISMWAVDLLGLQESARQFLFSGCIGLVLASYAFTLPNCPIVKSARTSPGPAPSDRQKRRTQIHGRSTRTQGILPFQREKNGHLLHLLHAFGCFPANHQRFCKPIHLQFRRQSRICQHLRREACQHAGVFVTNIGNTVHSAYSA